MPALVWSGIQTPLSQLQYTESEMLRNRKSMYSVNNSHSLSNTDVSNLLALLLMGWGVWGRGGGEKKSLDNNAA